jgi:hypothetical protein
MFGTRIAQGIWLGGKQRIIEEGTGGINFWGNGRNNLRSLSAILSFTLSFFALRMPNPERRFSGIYQLHLRHFLPH